MGDLDLLLHAYWDHEPRRDELCESPYLRQMKSQRTSVSQSILSAPLTNCSSCFICLWHLAREPSRYLEYFSRATSR